MKPLKLVPSKGLEMLLSAFGILGTMEARKTKKAKYTNYILVYGPDNKVQTVETIK